MDSGSTQFVPSKRMSIYESIHQMALWDDFKGNNCLDSSSPMLLEVDAKLDNQSEDTSHATLGTPNKYDDQEASRPDKVLRRLAQNREAARKSRMRKKVESDNSASSSVSAPASVSKAYVKQLENSKVRFIQLEQELDRVHRQGLYVGSLDATQLAFSGALNTGVTTFEMEYGHWLEEQNKHISDLRNVLHSDIGDMELRIFVDNALRHCFDLFSIKASAAKADVFYIMSGLWTTPVERFFFWIGGSRPSELLKVLLPYLEPLTEQQRVDISNLRQSCQQGEDALSLGMDKLHQILAETIAGGRLGEGNYLPQIGSAMEKLEALIRFLGQADHLRQETLQQISRILTTRQAARGLVALGEYFQRLQDLSSLWSTRPRETAQ